MKLSIGAAVAAIALCASAAHAQVTVGAGHAGHCYPFSCNNSGSASGTSIDYQQIYSSTAFNAPITFNQITFYDSGLGGSGDLLSGNYDIVFGTTSEPLESGYPITMSNTQTFFHDTVAGSSATSGVSFTGTPITYDPTSGDNLVMEIIVNDQALVPNFTQNSYMAFDESGNFTTRAYVVGNGAPQNDEAGLVTTFSSVAVSAAPEPAAWLLMLGGLGAMGLMLRRSKTMKPAPSSQALSA